MGRIADILMIIALITLMTFYLYVLFLSLNPRVSKEYYEYYISKTIDLSPKELANLREISPNVLYGHSSSKYIGFYKGWKIDPWNEKSLKWSSANKSSIIFIISDNNLFLGQLNLSVLAMGNQDVEIFLNGYPIFSGSVVDNKDLIINFDKNILKKGINELTFHIPNAKRRDIFDRRKYAISITKFNLQ